MQFVKSTLSDLLGLVAAESYPGGSHSDGFDDLRRYIDRKSIDGEPVRETFRRCYWTRVENVRRAEDKLLERSTNWNIHQLSNLSEAPGVVYVLRRGAPIARRTTRVSIAPRRCGCSGCAECTTRYQGCATEVRLRSARLCCYCRNQPLPSR